MCHSTHARAVTRGVRPGTGLGVGALVADEFRSEAGLRTVQEKPCGAQETVRWETALRCVVVRVCDSSDWTCGIPRHRQFEGSETGGYAARAAEVARKVREHLDKVGVDDVAVAIGIKALGQAPGQRRLQPDLPSGGNAIGYSPCYRTSESSGQCSKGEGCI